MPNRIIRDKCRYSPSLDQLSHGAERMFWRLVTVADDFGRFEADPRILLAACFPLKVQTLKIGQIDSWRSELISADLIFLYEGTGHLYGQFRNADAYFDKRAKTSKYPEPTDASICAHMPADSLGARLSGHVSEARNRGTRLPPRGLLPVEAVWPSPEALALKYNKETPDECRAITRLTDARRRKAREYLAQFPDEEFWTGVFKQFHASKFLRGLTPPSAGHKSFTADLDWLLTKGKDGSENAVKVSEGRYRD
jgi:hypothetical protein